MAQIVLGIGTSHSPMINTPPEHWLMHAARDHSYPLYGTDGVEVPFDERASANAGRLNSKITVGAMHEYFARSEKALATLRQEIKVAAPNVCVIIGDDQDEMFHHDNMPAFSVYYGDQILCKKPDMSKKPEALKISAWGYYTDEPTTYPGHKALALHIINEVIAAGFDTAASATQPGGTGMSHAYTFLYRRLLDSNIPIVPVFINTYYPPNQPRTARVLQFAAAVRAALSSFPGKERIAVIASGGLSHFLVNEDLDRSVLGAMSSGELSGLATLSEDSLKSGNSEIKNWAATAGIMAPLKMNLIDYIPAYRSKAGSGCGLAYGVWK